MTDVVDSDMQEQGKPDNFIEKNIIEDISSGLNKGRVQVRFPPQPNGYLHIGHAKAICLNFGLASRFEGHCNLRFDDTNPLREKQEYVDSIQEDIRWLGFEWDQLCFASDYFDQFHDWAVQLIGQGDAYVCDLTAEEVREYRGGLKEPGRDSPHRDRTIEENLRLFALMKGGEFPDGSKTLRARIDMASPHIIMRDPVMYRILRSTHHRTGDDWCIYPTYDWAHGQGDAIEGVTHSLCSLEFTNHRPLYEWFLDKIGLEDGPRQTEFARLALSYTVMSKRSLRTLIEDGHVEGWDDPRLPTLSGMRRRGYTPESIRSFMNGIGVAKFNSTIEYSVLENSIRDHLNKIAPRRMAVFNPLKLVIENFPEDLQEMVEAVNNPEDSESGTRQLPFERELWVDRDDFRLEPPRKWRRLAPGAEVRLRYGYCVTVQDVIQNSETGEVEELRCVYDPETARGQTPDGRKVRGIIHWVPASCCIELPVRLYSPLFVVPDPDHVPEGKQLADLLAPGSLEETTALCEPSLQEANPGDRFQLERVGYFIADQHLSCPGAPHFARIVPLRDSWAKQEKRQADSRS
ncbi:MAG: glutamine--tRNA ligase [Bacillota bacterium]|nr:MAG: glutamine--tRNA ligase [Planctomycetota bacterium]RUA10865.1 MAG: glutamine--tRNA ligase [Bacillota bacterium]